MGEITARGGAVDSIQSLEDEWEDLADRTSSTPFVRPGWIAAWWRAFGSGTLTLLTSRRDGRLAGVVPVVRRHRKLEVPTNWHTPVFGVVAEDEDVARELCYEMFATGARRVDLAFVDEDDPHADAFRWAAAHAEFRVSGRTLLRSPYIDTSGDWSEMESSLGRKRRSEIRRRRRLLEGQGTVELQIEAGAERLGPLLSEGFRVEAAAWKGLRSTAIASRADTKAFYTEVAAWAARKGWLRLAFLRVDGRALAFDLCLEHDGVHYLLKTGYDPAFRAFGPGILLRHDMLARAYALGLKRYEFLGNDDHWKQEWTTTVHHRRLLRALGPLWVGPVDWKTTQLARALRRTGRPLRDIRHR